MRVVREYRRAIHLLRHRRWCSARGRRFGGWTFSDVWWERYWSADDSYCYWVIRVVWTRDEP